MCSLNDGGKATVRKFRKAPPPPLPRSLLVAAKLEIAICERGEGGATRRDLVYLRFESRGPTKIPANLNNYIFKIPNYKTTSKWRRPHA